MKRQFTWFRNQVDVKWVKSNPKTLMKQSKNLQELLGVF